MPAVVPPADAFSFEVDLSDASNAVIDRGVGDGTFISDFATKTSLTTSALSADGNVPVTFTVVVTNQDGTNSPGVGHVDFFDGQPDLGSATLDGTGTATFSTSFIVPDIHEVIMHPTRMNCCRNTSPMGRPASLFGAAARAMREILIEQARQCAGNEHVGVYVLENQGEKRDARPLKVAGQTS